MDWLWKITWVGVVVAGCANNTITVDSMSGEDETTTGEQDTDAPDPSTTDVPDPTIGPADTGPDDTGPEDTGPVEDRCDPPGEPTLEVGHGANGQYAPFSDGPAQLVYGEQGGMHIDLGLRAEYLDTTGAFLSDIRGYFEGVQVATGSGGTFFECLPTGEAQVRTGIRLIFEGSPPDVDPLTVDVVAEHQDTTGISLMAMGSVVVVDPT